jgi:hypothetical protein
VKDEIDRARETSREKSEESFLEAMVRCASAGGVTEQRLIFEISACVVYA